MRIILKSLATLALGLASLAAQAQTVIFDNFGADLGSSGALIGNIADYYRRLAVPFTTPPVRQFVFHSVDAPMGGSGNLPIALAADNNGVPGTFLSTWAQSVSSPWLVRRWYASDLVLLEGNTRYWIVAPSSGTGGFTWTSSPISDSTGGTLHSISGGDWVPIFAGSATPAYRVNVAVAIGACCSPQLGTCVSASIADCDALRHTFVLGAVCSPSPCPPAPPQAACCNLATANCAVTSQSTCQTLGGRWTAGSPACEPLPCFITIPDAACCTGTTCAVIPVLRCAMTGGRLLGSGTTCVPISGTNPCCPTDFNNTGDITVQDLFDYLASFFARCP